MTATPGPAPAGSAVPAPSRRPGPVPLAVLAASTYAVALLVWLLLPWDAGVRTAGGRAVLAGLDLTRLLVPVVLLTALRLWRRCGVTTPPTGRALLPALPLAVPVVLPLLFGSGLADRAAWAFAVGAVDVATVAFGEEALFRGVVLRVLLPRGVNAAAVGSAVLFGLMHLVNLAAGNHPVDVGAQVVMATGLGIAYAAVALATGTIWPLVAVHFTLDYVNAIQAAAPAAASGGTLTDHLATGLVNVVLGALFAAYGGWLLHRRHGLLRQLDPAGDERS